MRTAETMKYILGGAVHGALVWTAYGVVEQGFCFLLPMLHGLHTIHGASEWGIAAALASGYCVLGVLLGAAAGLVLAKADACVAVPGRTPSADRLRAAAVASLSLGFAANEALVRPFGRAEAFSLVLSAALATVLIQCARSERCMAALGGLANPWAASALLLCGGSIGREVLSGSPPAIQLATAVATVALVAGTAVIGSRLWRKQRFPRDRFLPARAAIAFLAAVCLVAVLGVVATSVPPEVQLPASTNAMGHPILILVTMDTVRADHLSLYGYDEATAPFLSRFAQSATVFMNAVATSDQTLTTHASIFTGLYGSWHGAYPISRGFARGRPLGREPLTLAQYLARNGYRTMAVVANHGYLGPAFGLDRGFEQCDVQIPSTIGDAFYLRETLLRWMRHFFKWGGLYRRCARADQVNRAAVALMKEAAKGPAPLFLFVNYMDAHVPYIPPSPFDALFPGRSDTLGPGDYPRMRAEVMAGERAITPDERRHFMSQYDGGICYIDTEIGRLIDRLTGLGVLENSMIVICSDHGEAFGEHGLVQHGVSVYQDQVHIPLIIKFPGQHAPRTVTAPVSEVDLMPTILSALGVDVPHGLVGVDLRRDADETPRTLFSESFFLRGFGSKFDRTERAAVRWPMKLIVSTAGKRELYNLANDPGESRNLFREDDPRARDLLTRLTEWVRAIPPLGEEAPQLDLDTLRRLKALGYVN